MILGELITKPLNVLLRDKVNETEFILAKYQNYNSKDQYSCIVSAMDWIDVGMTNIDKALDELIKSSGLETCIKFYQYISCIDIVWSAICQLHRVFIDKKMPFNNDSSVFKKKYFDKDDNLYFEEIRACFGAHPVELKENKKADTIRKFASWSTHFGNSTEMSVLVYSNIPNSGFNEVKVTVDELQKFYEMRCQYIQVIIDTIDNIVFCFKEDMKNSEIHKSNEPVEQIQILKDEAVARFGGLILIEELEQIEHFFSMSFCSNYNEEAIENFRQNLILGINEIYDCLQRMDVKDTLKISTLLSPRYLPSGNNGFCNEFSNLYFNVFCKGQKYFNTCILTESLKEYIRFEYITMAELYWLVVIALNLAQEDFRDSHIQKEIDMDALLECLNKVLK